MSKVHICYCYYKNKWVTDWTNEPNRCSNPASALKQCISLSFHLKSVITECCAIPSGLSRPDRALQREGKNGLRCPVIWENSGITPQQCKSILWIEPSGQHSSDPPSLRTTNVTHNTHQPAVEPLTRSMWGYYNSRAHCWRPSAMIHVEIASQLHLIKSNKCIYKALFTSADVKVLYRNPA